MEKGQRTKVPGIILEEEKSQYVVNQNENSNQVKDKVSFTKQLEAKIEIEKLDISDILR